jgi:hypothetical protein
MLVASYGHEPTWPMPVESGHRAGVIYVDEDHRAEPGKRYIASWQARIGGSFFFAPYFVFDNIEDALVWARERGERVRVGVIEDNSWRFYTGGVVPFPDLPQWPTPLGEGQNDHAT